MTSDLLKAVVAADQDFEWYPTTQRMVEAVKRWLPEDADSILDIGAGDGRVLAAIAAKCRHATLYAIEKSTVLMQAQPDTVVPVGTEFYEQTLSCLQVDFIFCNPPYSDFEQWAITIIESGFAERAYLVIPRRWKDIKAISDALKRRGASARVIHSDDFHDAERQARAVVDVVEIAYPRDEERNYGDAPKDPFDTWFDQNVSTFERASDEPREDDLSQELARKYGQANIGELVDGYREEYSRMEANYKAIFTLDHALLKELGVTKDAVREGIKAKMKWLKTKYWQLLFNRLDAITSRLSTKTKEKFLSRLTGTAQVAFTAGNAYAVVLWAIKNANKYYDEQLIALFRELSTFESVLNYKSNQKTWQRDKWRYNDENQHDHYGLDYRIVVSRWSAITKSDWNRWEYPGNLHKGCHELLADAVAVLSNLGYPSDGSASVRRHWEAGQWQDFHTSGGDVLFQAKAHINGNLHFRFMPAAIRRLNIEAGRLLGWLRSADDAVRELGCSPEEAKQAFGANMRIAVSNLKLLTN